MVEARYIVPILWSKQEPEDDENERVERRRAGQRGGAERDARKRQIASVVARVEAEQQPVVQHEQEQVEQFAEEHRRLLDEGKPERQEGGEQQPGARIGEQSPRDAVAKH